MSGNGGEFGLSLGAFFQRRLEGVFLPGLFFNGRLAIRGRSLRRRYDLCGSLGLFTHAHRSRGLNQTTIPIVREFNAIRKVRKGQVRRGLRAEKMELVDERADKKNGPGGSARAAERE